MPLPHVAEITFHFVGQNCGMFHNAFKNEPVLLELMLLELELEPSFFRTNNKYQR